MPLSFRSCKAELIWMGTVASPKLLNMLQPKRSCWIVPHTETLLGKGRAEAPGDLPPHVQFVECGM